MLIEMASCDVSAATLENLGQGLFGVQLEVTEKLLEAEKKKLTQLELQLDEETRHGISSVEKAKELTRQKSNYARLSIQHHQLAKEYEEAARGLLRKSTKQRRSTRSLPSLGFKQTVKARPTIFGNLVQEDWVNHNSKSVEKKTTLLPSRNVAHPSDFTGDVVFKEGHVTAGTLSGLIERLVPLPNYYPDRTYVFAFLLCSRLFILPGDLLSRISKACAEQLKNATPEEAKVLAFNLVQLLSEWTETFPNDFKDEVMMMHIKDITSYCASLTLDLRNMVGQMTQSLFKKLALLDKYEEILLKATAAAEDRKLTGSTKYKCCMEVCPNPVMLAQQLCHIEMERLVNIGPEEFVQTFIPRDEADLRSTLSYIKKTSSLEAYIEWFNRLGYLVATEVCLGNKKKHRAKIIEYYVEVATECYDKGNFNSAMAIIAGLNMSPVARLKKTWSRVKCRKFDRLEREMNPASNFACYRTMFKVATESKGGRFEFTIPFFSLFVKDVYFLNEGHSNRLPNGHINFEKFWRLSKLITDFVTWREVACKYDRNRTILNYLMTVPVLSEKNLALMSYECEAPETQFEKERRKSLRAERNAEKR